MYTRFIAFTVATYVSPVDSTVSCSLGKRCRLNLYSPNSPLFSSTGLSCDSGPSSFSASAPSAAMLPPGLPASVMSFHRISGTGATSSVCCSSAAAGAIAPSNEFLRLLPKSLPAVFLRVVLRAESSGAPLSSGSCDISDIEPWLPAPRDTSRSASLTARLLTPVLLNELRDQRVTSVKTSAPAQKAFEMRRCLSSWPALSRSSRRLSIRAFCWTTQQ